MAGQLHTLVDSPPWKPGGILCMYNTCNGIIYNVYKLAYSTLEHVVLDVHWIVSEKCLPAPR